MTRTEILKRLSEIMRDVLDLPELELAEEMTAKDVKGWDSFKMIEIIIETQDVFGIKLTTQEVDSFLTVADLIDSIGRRTLT